MLWLAGVVWLRSFRLSAVSQSYSAGIWKLYSFGRIVQVYCSLLQTSEQQQICTELGWWVSQSSVGKQKTYCKGLQWSYLDSSESSIKPILSGVFLLTCLYLFVPSFNLSSARGTLRASQSYKIEAEMSCCCLFCRRWWRREPDISGTEAWLKRSRTPNSQHGRSVTTDSSGSTRSRMCWKRFCYHFASLRPLGIFNSIQWEIRTQNTININANP